MSQRVPKPDWDRYVMKNPAMPPVGDPTRWGARVDTQLEVGTGSTRSSAQILMLSTRDAYSRSWALLGTLSMPVSVWNDLVSSASIVSNMGVGQISLNHEIALWRQLAPAGGLCFQQDVAQGGPYVPTPAFPRVVNGVTIQYQTRAFAMVGAFVGQGISVRSDFLIGGGLNPDLPAPATIELIATPFAAGSGL